GCMPLHFTTPGLGGEAITFLHRGQWQVGVAGRRVATNRFYVGDQETESEAPFGQPLHLRLNSIDLSVRYAVSDRVTATATVPYFYGTQEITNADNLRHQSSNSGIGDVSAGLDMWLISPTSHPDGNVSAGLAVKAPTGANLASFQFHLPNATTVPMTLTPTLQLGDGGWAVLAQLNAFQHLTGPVSAYASGLYSVSTRTHTDETFQGLTVAVPDVYTARAGLGFALVPDAGLSVSLGGRIDGTPASDLIGGRTDYKRDGGYYLYVEPGLAWVAGPNQFTLSVPVRVRAEYFSMRLSDGTLRPGEGGVNDYIVYAGYSRRF
ncbi:MAG: hypothetical protein ACREL5_13635, partial [Gemmatimonadales bacterium]